MVFSRFKEVFSGNDEKYEVLYHNYSKVKLENKKLKQQHEEELRQHKHSVHKNVAKKLVNLFEDIEMAKQSSFKVVADSKELQRLMIDLNKSEKTLRELMVDFSLEEIVPKERFYDPELHEVASYKESKDMQKGIIIKTIAKGFAYRGERIKKPRVVVIK